MSNDRSIGKISFEEALIIIMNENNCYESKALKKIVDNRADIKKDSFKYLHPEIRQSTLFPFYDAVYLSYEQGILKPDVEIYRRCMNELDVETPMEVLRFL